MRKQSPHSHYPNLTDAQMARHRAIVRRVFGEGDHTRLETFRAMMKASNLITSLSEKGLDRHGLSLAKTRVLFMLAVCETEGMLPSEISKMQGVMPNTVSSSLASLRDAGLIEQAAHPIDGRKRVVRITPAGHAALTEIGPLQRGFVNGLFDDFDDEEVLTLNRLVVKLLDNVQRMSDREDTAPASSDPAASDEHPLPAEHTP